MKNVFWKNEGLKKSTVSGGHTAGGIELLHQQTTLLRVECSTQHEKDGQWRFRFLRKVGPFAELWEIGFLPCLVCIWYCPCTSLLPGKTDGATHLCIVSKELSAAC